MKPRWLPLLLLLLRSVSADEFCCPAHVQFAKTNGRRERHSCLLIDCRPFCSGDGSHGQLGVPQTLVALATPIELDGLFVDMQTSSVAGSKGVTCMLRSDGDLFCVGSNENAQVGPKKHRFFTDPQVVFRNVRTFTMTSTVLCVITTDGNAACVGSNKKFHIAKSAPPRLHDVPLVLTPDIPGELLGLDLDDYRMVLRTTQGRYVRPFGSHEWISASHEPRKLDSCSKHGCCKMLNLNASLYCDHHDGYDAEYDDEIEAITVADEFTCLLTAPGLSVFCTGGHGSFYPEVRQEWHEVYRYNGERLLNTMCDAAGDKDESFLDWMYDEFGVMSSALSVFVLLYVVGVCGLLCCRKQVPTGTDVAIEGDVVKGKADSVNVQPVNVNPADEDEDDAFTISVA